MICKSIVVLCLLVLCSCRVPREIKVLAANSTEPSDTIPESTACPIYGEIAQNLDIDVEVISAFEGMRTRFYQPSDASGPTIGPGLDISASGPKMVKDVLRCFVSPKELDTILSASGLRGAAARRWVDRHQEIVLDSCVLQPMLHRQCSRYWQFIVGTRPYLATAPHEVRTALLSFFMHRGSIEMFAPELRTRNWRRLAEHMSASDNSVSGDAAFNFQRRRRLEARLIQMVGQEGPIDRD